MTKINPDKILQVEVTQEDIDKSPRNGAIKCHSCPIYRALDRVLGREIAVFEEQTSRFNLIDGDMLFQYNHDGRAFIEAFDSGKEVKPCTITFTLTEE